MVTSIKKSQNKMPAWYILAWNSRAVSSAVNVVILLQITYFSTDIVGLDPGLVGTLFLVSKVFDGFTDLIAGFIIDKTKTKLGKARPYELFVIPLWILIVFLFSTPDMSTTGKAAYIFIFYTLINAVCATFLRSAETVFLGRAVDNDQGRAKIMAVGGVIVMVVSTIAAMLLPQLMNTWGRQPGGWTRIALVYAVPMVIIGMFRFLFIKERPFNDDDDERNKVKFMDGIKALVKNKYIFILAALILLSGMGYDSISIVGAYYFQNVLGNIGLLSLVSMTGLAGPFLLLLFPVALRTLGSIGFVRIGLVLAAATNCLRFFFPTNLPVLLITGLFGGVGMTSIVMMNHFFILQCVEYGERKTGIRVEGIPASICSFSGKMGNGLASAGVGMLMAAGGYVSTAATQPEGAVMSIRLLYSIIPAAICVVMIIVLHFFNVEKVLYGTKE
jgi:GPH family glycoside/pentoside/hexuronide:cation symporter